ncbi:MAG TPA: hypothetical protein EYQ27_15170 [Gemmatimonadetes bacterium]|nr:hypothetical protein [Gemmatimonadota bacterium]
MTIANAELQALIATAEASATLHAEADKACEWNSPTEVFDEVNSLRLDAQAAFRRAANFACRWKAPVSIQRMLREGYVAHS